MAEYYMTYDEMSFIIDQAMRSENSSQLLQEYQPAIMAAIVGNYDTIDHKAAADSVAFWKNIISEPSQFRVGTHYIRVQSAMLEFIKAALCSGVVDAIIQVAAQTGPISLTIATTSSVVIALGDLFSKASKLEDDDFCVFMQATTHFREHKAFTEEELMSWFPQSERKKCNMHNSTWQCDYLLDNDVCDMNQEKLQNTLKSLQNKGILRRRKNDEGRYEFYFLK